MNHESAPIEMREVGLRARAHRLAGPPRRALAQHAFLALRARESSWSPSPSGPRAHRCPLSCRILAPALRGGQVVVMDNLLPTRVSALGRSLRARAVSCCICQRTCRTSAPFNWLISKVKGLPRKAEVKSWDALIEAIGRALDAVSSQDARDFFGHCRFRTWSRSF
jgi:hypothetical protein